MRSTELLVSVRTLKDNLESWAGRIVDCRGESEFKRGHIPGAINVPNSKIQDPQSDRGELLPLEVIAQNLGQAGVSPSVPLVLYDDSGLVPSARLFWVMELLGHTNVSILNGGLISWLNEGFPLGKEAVQVSSIEFPWTLQDSKLATKGDVLTALDDPGITLVDARSKEEYTGLKITADRNGHIPGAILVNWEEHIKGLFDPEFLPFETLETLYHNRGVTRDREIIVYCRSGARSSHTYFTLRWLGFDRVRNYAGSWLEWGNDQDTPIEM